jgi:hypothetical protein
VGAACLRLSVGRAIRRSSARSMRASPTFGGLRRGNREAALLLCVLASRLHGEGVNTGCRLRSDPRRPEAFLVCLGHEELDREGVLVRLPDDLIVRKKPTSSGPNLLVAARLALDASPARPGRPASTKAELQRCSARLDRVSGGSRKAEQREHKHATRMIHRCSLLPSLDKAPVFGANASAILQIRSRIRGRNREQPDPDGAPLGQAVWAGRSQKLLPPITTGSSEVVEKPATCALPAGE